MPPPTEHLLVQTQAGLDDVCDLIAAHEQLAIDTEFVRTNTYAPHLGLVQIAAGDDIFCIDPLADIRLDGFWELLFDPNRRSIIHSGSQDMEVLWFTCAQVIPNIIDTQTCAALLGYPAQIGYAGLAAELVGAEIAKTQTRTDWSKRPLTDAQIHYAAEDVEHLGKMHGLLKQRLDELGRYNWALEDSAALTNIDLYKPDPATAWQRLKSIPFLPVDQQARARALAQWREERAVKFDKPRSWILSDKALLQLAELNPRNTSALREVDDLPPAVIRKQGEHLVKLLADANAGVASGELRFEQQFPDRERDKAQVKKCSQIIRDIATELGIASEVVGSKRDILALIRGDKNARLIRGWRGELVGTRLLAVVN
jgi:ribonuclease D